jgi:hypothetical protein
MKQRCVELNVPMVEEYYYGRADDIMDILPEGVDWTSAFIRNLQAKYLEKIAVDCDNNPDEGIVIKIEGLNIEAYKLKSEKFYLKESKSHEDEVVDIEEYQSA